MHIMDQSTLMEPKCNITEHFHANSAFTRARTQTCKSQINELYCSSLERERSSDVTLTLMDNVKITLTDVFLVR